MSKKNKKFINLSFIYPLHFPYISIFTLKHGDGDHKFIIKAPNVSKNIFTKNSFESFTHQ